MSVPRVYSVVLLTVALGSCVVHCGLFHPGRGIPGRCREVSVTPVSCADTHFLDNLLPHPDDCELFYYCVTPISRPICRQCPAHLHFNPRLHVCDHPAVAGCSAPPSTDEPTGGTTASVGETATAGATTEEPTAVTTGAAETHTTAGTGV